MLRDGKFLGNALILGTLPTLDFSIVTFRFKCGCVVVSMVLSIVVLPSTSVNWLALAPRSGFGKIMLFGTVNTQYKPAPDSLVSSNQEIVHQVTRVRELGIAAPDMLMDFENIENSVLNLSRLWLSFIQIFIRLMLRKQ